MKMSIFLYLFIPIVCVAILPSSCGQADRTSGIPDKDTIPVTLAPLSPEEQADFFEATGVFTTDDETLLSFKNGGVIAQIYVNEGDRIEAGQLLARVRADEVDAMASQSALALGKAKRDYERARKLYLDSVATLEQMQNAQTALGLAEQDAKRVRLNQQYTEIRAAGQGYVLARLAQEGQVVGPGTPVLQINGADGSNWQLKVGVSDRQWAIVRQGDTARITADVWGERSYDAVVRKKSEGLDPRSGTFSIFLALSEVPSAKLAAGMFGRAYIYARSNNRSGWTVPYESLVEGNGKEGYVFVTDDRKTARKVKVRIAAINLDHVLVSEGLEGAEALIISGSAYLMDGSPIKVVQH